LQTEPVVVLPARLLAASHVKLETPVVVLQLTTLGPRRVAARLIWVTS
jgi:hypothetical protein